MKKLVGVPWRKGGRDARPIIGGADCVGIVLAGLAEMGFQVEDPVEWVATWWRPGATIPSMPTPWKRVTDPTTYRPGDVLVSDDNTHVSLVVPRGLVLSSIKGGGSCLLPLRKAIERTGSVWRIQP